MRPVVGLAQADKQHPRLLRLDVFDGRVEGQRIERFIRPDARRLRLQRVQQRQLWGHGNCGQRIVACIHHEPAVRAVEDAVEDFPRAKGRHLARKLRLGVEPRKDGRIRVGNIVVRVDARVGDSRQRFAVAGIAEVEDVRDVRIGAEIAVAEDLSLRAPPRSTGKASAPCVARRRGAARTRFCASAAISLGSPSHFRPGFSATRVSAAEHILPAHSVHHHHDHILSLVRGRNLRLQCRPKQHRRGCQQNAGQQPMESPVIFHPFRLPQRPGLLD